MNGFRTALIVCGVFIMAFVLLWSTHQQRHQQRRGVIGRFGSDPDLDRLNDDTRIEPGVKMQLDQNQIDPEKEPNLSYDASNDLNGSLNSNSDDAMSATSSSRRFSVSEPGSAHSVRLEAGKRETQTGSSASATTGTGSDRPSFRSRLGGSRLPGISKKRFGRFSSSSDSSASAADTKAGSNAEVTAVGPLAPANVSSSAAAESATEKPTSGSRFRRGLQTGRRFMSSGGHGAARRTDPGLRPDAVTPRLNMPESESSANGSLFENERLPTHSPSSGDSHSPVPAVEASPQLSASNSNSAPRLENNAAEKKPKFSTARGRWWQGRLPRLGNKSRQSQKPNKHPSTDAVSTAASAVMPEAMPELTPEIGNESGYQHQPVASAKNEANREERKMFKRTNDRPGDRSGDREQGPLRARQTSPASLWGESGASTPQKPDSRRRSNGSVTGARRTAVKGTKSGGASSPARADGKHERKSTFGSRYSRARRRSENTTQAVRDTSLPSRSQPRSSPDTSVFAGLLDRLSSAVGKSDNRNHRPSRRHPLEKHEAVEQREPMLTVSGFDEMSEDKMILPANEAGDFDTDHGLSGRDNEGNIDRLQIGAARATNSNWQARDDREQSRQDLRRELDAAEQFASEPLKPQFDLSNIDTSRQIDQIAQIVGLNRPVSRDAVMTIYRSNEDLISKPIRIIGLSAIDRSWVDLEQEPETGEYTEIVLTVQLYDARGPINESDLHRFSDVVLQTADHIGGQPHFAMSFEDALEHGASLELFCKDYDRLAILSIVVGDSSPIGGEPLGEFADSRGLVLNSVKIYHWPNPDPEGSPWRFGIANLFEPGTFNEDPDSGFETRGLRLFMSIPTVREPEKVFDDMVTVAQDLCVRFSATIVDQNKKPLSDQGIADIRRQMVAVSEEMRGHGFAPGDENTIRIFPEFGQN